MHTNRWRCGVARFNVRLAEELQVPVVPWSQAEEAPRPRLISVRPEEIPTPLSVHPDDQIFLHGLPLPEGWQGAWVWAANAEIKASLPYAELVWVPGLRPCRPAPFPSIHGVFLWGMAHKVCLELHERLAEVLPPHVPVYASFAPHEQESWPDAIEQVERTLRLVYGHRFRFLGFMADEALEWVFRQVSVVAALFPSGMRANNTTAWTALEQGRVLLTTLDRYSPPELVPQETCLDLRQLKEWPSLERQRHLATQGSRVAALYSWPRLVRRLHGPLFP